MQSVLHDRAPASAPPSPARIVVASLTVVPAAIFIALAPLMSNYVLFGAFGWGDLFLLVSLVSCLAAIRTDRLFFGSLFAAVSLALLNFLVLSESGVVRVSFLRASAFLLFSICFLSVDRRFLFVFARYYLYAAVLSSAYLIVQALLYYAFGYVWIVSLPLATYERETLLVIDIATQGFRTGGLFKEPSYFAIYLTPALIWMALVRRILLHAVLGIAALLSTSSLGIAMALVSVLLYLFGSRWRVRMAGMYAVTLGVVTASSIVFTLGSVPGIDRFQDIFVSGGTLNERVLPITSVLGEADGAFVRPELHTAVTQRDVGTSIWYNSFIYLLGMFGWLTVLWLMLVFLKVGVFFGPLLFVLLIATNLFTSPSLFVLLLLFRYLRARPYFADDRLSVSQADRASTAGEGLDLRNPSSE